MDFYNFEKHNDVFCFEKLSNDYQPSLKTYKDNYKNSLNSFLKEYEENTELRFIETQLYFCDKEINIQKSIITSLAKFDNETFYYVRNRIGNKYCVYSKTLRDPFENNSLSKQTSIEICNQDNNSELKEPVIIHYLDYCECGCGINGDCICKGIEECECNMYDDEPSVYQTAPNFIKFISNRITSLCLINEFLEQQKKELEKELKPPTKITEPQNKHATIFVNDSYKLFEYILNNYVAEKRGRINDISFYYWKMYNDKLIIQKPFPFQDWFSKNYDEVIGKIQTLDNVSNPNRLKHYSTALDWYKTIK